MMTEEDLNFTRGGVIRIYEKMLAGEMSEEDFHKAAANTEAILKADGISDIKVRYMGVPEPEDYDPYPNLSRIMGITFKKPEPQQTKLFEEKEKDEL